jgi:hypothetical protein
MVELKITLKSGSKFPSQMPLELNYFMSFQTKTDYLIMDTMLYDTMNFVPDEEFTFEISPSSGMAIKFVGVFYNAKKLSDNVAHLRMTFVSKYYLGLMSSVPLYGGGNVADIIETFYRKANVPQVKKDRSTVSFDTILLPRTTTVNSGIAYLLEHAVATGGAQDAYLVSTVVQDTAYIRSVKNGEKDIENMYYTIDSVQDNRRKIDIFGGLKMKMLNDSKDANALTQTLPGDNKVERNVFYAISDKVHNRAKARVTQARAYYSRCLATITMLGWIPLFGSNLVVKNNDKDMYQSIPVEFKSLMQGKYFCNTQCLNADMRSSKELSICNIQLVEDV